MYRRLRRPGQRHRVLLGKRPGHCGRAAGGATTDSPPVVVHTRTIVEGGMPGWQIVLIAVGAAVAAAVLAVLIDRARLARRKPAPAVAAPEPTRVA
jgi:hypothetical protein